MGADLRYGRLIDHWADGHTGLRAGTDPHGINAIRQFFCKGVINACLNENAVGADAGLPTIAELRNERAFHGQIEIGIVENDKGRVAAQFQREPLYTVGSASHQD
jgi:hypothetical protein